MYSPEFPFEAIAVDSRGMSIHILVANRWTFVCLFFGAIAALIINRVKEVQKLSFGFSWWDKQAQVQVSVESSNTRNSFTVTADGLFNSKPYTLSSQRILTRSCGEPTRATLEKQLKIIRAKSAPSLNTTIHTSSQPVETDEKIEHSINGVKKKRPVDSKAEKMQLCKPYQSLQRGFAFTDWSSVVQDIAYGCDGPERVQSLEHSESALSLPNWAKALLEPVEVKPFFKRRPNPHLPSMKRWDAFLDKRVEMSVSFQQKLTSSNDLSSPSNASQELFVSGPHHMARAKDRVVKIWDRSRKLFLKRLHISEGAISVLELHWEAKKAFIGNFTPYVSVWDLYRGKCVAKIDCHDPLRTIQCNSSCCFLTGSHSFQDPLASVRIWDTRALKHHAGIISSTIPPVSAVASRGEECYVRDIRGFISAYDLRINSTKPLQMINPAICAIREKMLPKSETAKHRVDDGWWDADMELQGSEDCECEEDEGSWIKPHCSTNTSTCLLSKFISAVCSFAMPPSLPNHP